MKKSMKKILIFSLVVVSSILCVVIYKWYQAVQIEHQTEKLYARSTPVAGTLETGPLPSNSEDNIDAMGGGATVTIESRKNEIDESEFPYRYDNIVVHFPNMLIQFNYCVSTGAKKAVILNSDTITIVQCFDDQGVKVYEKYIGDKINILSIAGENVPSNMMQEFFDLIKKLSPCDSVSQNTCIVAVSPKVGATTRGDLLYVNFLKKQVLKGAAYVDYGKLMTCEKGDCHFDAKIIKNERKVIAKYVDALLQRDVGSSGITIDTYKKCLQLNELEACYRARFMIADSARDKGFTYASYALTNSDNINQLLNHIVHADNLIGDSNNWSYISIPLSKNRSMIVIYMDNDQKLVSALTFDLVWFGDDLEADIVEILRPETLLIRQNLLNTTNKKIVLPFHREKLQIEWDELQAWLNAIHVTQDIIDIKKSIE